MRANELHSSLVKIQSDEETKSALLSIIDQKTESDMEKILAKIGAENQDIRSEVRNLKWTISIVIAVASLLIALIVKYL